MAVGLAQALPRARTQPLAPSRPNSVLALTSIASFMVALDALVVTTALSTIRIDLGAPIDALEWTVNAYNLSFAVLLLTGAALGDRFGRRRLFVIGIGLFTLAGIRAGCDYCPRPRTVNRRSRSMRVSRPANRTSFTASRWSTCGMAPLRRSPSFAIRGCWPRSTSRRCCRRRDLRQCPPHGVTLSSSLTAS